MSEALIQDFGRVAVLMGGWSAERPVSLVSGEAVLAALLRQSVDAHGVDVKDADVLRQLQEGDYQRAFVILHGRGGEDGVIQGALEVLGIPYTGCGVLASALAMDKRRSKMIWQMAGLPTPAYAVPRDAAQLAAFAERLGYPLMVKPVHEGSSMGMAKAEDLQQLQQAWQAARGFDAEVMVEQWIDGHEYTAGILGQQTLPLIRLETSNPFYDYQAKYESKETRYICPCGLPSDAEAEIQALADQAFRLLGGEGWGRVDLMRDATGQSWLIEANSIPGMTGHSLVPMAARQAGIEFDGLVIRILATASCSAQRPGQPAVVGRT